MFADKPRPTTSSALSSTREVQSRDGSLWPLGLLKVGKEHGYYQSDLLGEGLSSKVYRGVNVNTKRIVSIKVIKKQQMRENNIAALLYNEVKILKRLAHENVLGLQHFEENDRQLSLITEYCNGGDLGQMLSKKKKLPEYLALAILEDIIKGYGHLVANNIIHRDIKPANIFMSNGRAKLADFGFAMTKSDIFAKEQAVGSPLYMPPETLEHLDYSHKSDIFAIGVVFYEMLHGYMPWQAVTQKELLYRMKKKACTISQELHLSDKSKAFLEHSLERKVDNRMDERDLVSFFRKEKAKLLPYQKQTRVTFNESCLVKREHGIAEQETLDTTPRKETVVKQTVIDTTKRRRFDSYCQGQPKVEVKREFAIQQLIETAKTTRSRPQGILWPKRQGDLL